MNGRRYMRGLWYVWVCLCFLPCVVVTVQWVRSYWWSDLARTSVRQWPIEIVSGDGRIKFTRVDLTIGLYQSFATYPSDRSEAHTINRHLWNYPSVLGLGVVRRFDPAILLPYWFLSASCFAIGIVLTRRWSTRFSLRALLMWTTLVSVAMGFFEWLWRR
jgi:hypothetical protein